MYRDFFKSLAREKKGKFYFKDEDISIGMGVRSPNVTYKVTYKYKGNGISIMNRTGTAYVGVISCNLTSTLRPSKFEITNTSHFQNLFLRNKSRLKITAENSNLYHFIANNTALTQLDKIAAQHNFSPIITCTLCNVWMLEAKYHLEFDNWTAPVQPIVELFENLIDEFSKHYTYISEQNYREMN